MASTTRKTRTRGNGEGTAYKMPSGKWRAEITLGWITEKLPDETEKRKRVVKTKSGFKKKGDALRWIKDYKAEKDTVTNVTFKELYDRWSEAHYERVSKSTADGYRAAYKHCEHLYYKQFAQLKAADLQKAVDDCEHGYRTKYDIRSLMNNMYKYALENDLCEKNYAQFIKLPKKEKSKRDAFTTAERDALWADYHAGNKFTGEILFLIYCGLRFGEYKIIEKDNVYLDKQYMVGGIKTEAGTDRIIPLADVILPIAKELYDKAESKLLTIHEKVWYHNFHATLKRLGIRPLNVHCCRHTCATALAEAGVAPATIKAILGHKEYSTTLQYTHISIEELLAGVNKQYVPSSSSE